MSSAPRSSGTESVDTFRQALSRSMQPAPPTLAEDDARTDDDRLLRDRIRTVLSGGTPVAVGEVAAATRLPVATVLRVLGLAADTSPEQTVVARAAAGPPERPARKRRAAS